MNINKENRALSPHLYAYKPQVTSVISIFHRLTGSILAILLLCGPLYLSLIYSFASFSLVYFYLSLFFQFIKLFLHLLFVTFCFHGMNGIRHILWDFGIGLDLSNLFITGCIVLSMSVSLSYIVIIF